MSVELNQRGEEAHMLSTAQVDENWALIEAAINGQDTAIAGVINAVDGTLKKPPLLRAESNTGTQAYFTTLAFNPATYTDLVGYFIFLKPDTTNTSSAATLRVAPIVTGGDGSGNVSIRKNHDKLLEAGDIRAGKWNILFTDGTVFVLLNPGSAGKGNYDGTVPNGSFEVDTDADGVPDEWTKALPWAGGSFAIETTDVMHGTAAIKFTHPGGAGNGGGYAESGYIECTEKRAVMLQWLHKSSAAGILDKVELHWFDRTKTALGSPNNLTAIYSSTTNPTSWTPQQGVAIPPVTARYLKIRLTGGDSSVATGGTSYWDDVRFVEPAFNRGIDLQVAGTYTFIAPVSGLADIDVHGSGGGGGGGNLTPGRGGGGGGAGGYATKRRMLVANTTYTIVVGGGGAGGGGDAVGSAGNTSHFNSEIIATGGLGGATGDSGGLGGTGGTGSGGDVNSTGATGGTGAVEDGGTGGVHPAVGIRTAGGSSGAAPVVGLSGTGGAGGGRSGGSAQAGAAGAVGRVIVKWVNVP